MEFSEPTPPKFSCPFAETDRSQHTPPNRGYSTNLGKSWFARECVVGPGVVPQPCDFNGLQCQTSLTALTGAKDIFLCCQTVTTPNADVSECRVICVMGLCGSRDRNAFDIFSIDHCNCIYFQVLDNYGTTHNYTLLVHRIPGESMDGTVCLHIGLRMVRPLAQASVPQM